MPPPAGGFAVGDLVQLRASQGESRPKGMLMKYLGGDRWSVIMEDGDGSSQVVPAKDLMKFSPPPRSYSIVGSWDDWDAHEMKWDPERWCFEYDVVLGRTGGESFKVLLEGDWARCIYPDRLDAVPWDGHELKGPDDGSSKEWTIGEWTLGRHELGAELAGERYKVLFFVSQDGSPKSMSWERLPRERTPEERKVPKFSIVGSWDDWESHPLTWNRALGRYDYQLMLDETGVANFRFLLEGDWEKCVYPDRPDATPADGHKLRGPDDGGSLGEWSLGGAAGSSWQVHLFLLADGRPSSVSWDPVAEESAGEEETAQAATPPPARAPEPTAQLPTPPEAALPRLGGARQPAKACRRVDGGPLEEEGQEGARLDSILAEVCPRWSDTARSELARMGIQDEEELREAVTGPLRQWCKVTLGDKAMSVLRARWGAV